MCQHNVRVELVAFKRGLTQHRRKLGPKHVRSIVCRRTATRNCWFLLGSKVALLSFRVASRPGQLTAAVERWRELRNVAAEVLPQRVRTRYVQHRRAGTRAARQHACAFSAVWQRLSTFESLWARPWTLASTPGLGADTTVGANMKSICVVVTGYYRVQHIAMALKSAIVLLCVVLLTAITRAAQDDDGWGKPKVWLPVLLSTVSIL